MSNLSEKKAVIGLGNPSRKDDGIGILLLEELKKKRPGTDIDLLDFGTAGFDLINKLKDYKKALLIDGIDAGLKPGELRIFALDDIEIPNKGLKLSTHELNLASLLELVKTLDIKTDISVAGIQVKDVSFGSGLSEPLKTEFADNTAKIIKFLAMF